MSSEDKTIRLVYPLWQGGNHPLYHTGAEFLAWAAPQSSDKTIRVPVEAPRPGQKLQLEDGIVGRRAIVKQQRAAAEIIQRERPGRILTLGGDCLASLPGFAYLLDHYKDEKLGVLWVDAHPDVSTKDKYPHAHAHVLGALMGHGDADLVRAVPTTVPASRVMICGMERMHDYERAFLTKHKVPLCSPADVRRGGAAKITEWIQREGITRLVVHIDMDVLATKVYRDQFFANPAGLGALADYPSGVMDFKEVIGVITAANAAAPVVGLTVAEVMPWDLLHLQKMLRQMPLFQSNL